MSANELRRPILESALNNHYRPYTVQANIKKEKTSTLAEISGIVKASLQIQDKIFLAVLILIFLTGVLIGIYLLASEGHELRPTEIYNITSRELGKAQAPSATISKLRLPAEKVLFLQTNSSSSCDNKNHCAKLVKELQLKHMIQGDESDILYNFIVTRNGEIFEGRGWNFQTSFLNNSFDNVISVAFLGKFRITVPTIKQVESTKLFMFRALLEGRLQRCFHLVVLSNNRFFIEMAKNIQDSLSTCRKFI